MATINAASSTNAVKRMVFSKSRTKLRYDDRDSNGVFVGVAQFIGRLSVSEFKVTNPFTLT